MSQSRPDPDLGADLLALVLEIRDRITAIERHVMVRDASRDALRDGTNRRAREYRKRQKQQKLAKANDVACDRDASRDASLFSLQSPNSNHVKILSKEKEEKKESKKEVVARARGAGGRGTRLDKSASLTIEYFDTAVALGVARDRVGGLWDEFRDYWCAVPGQRGTKLDWLATWRNRLRHVGNGNGGSNGHGRRKTNLEAFAELDAHIERLAEAERGETGPREPLRSDPVRLLWTK